MQKNSPIQVNESGCLHFILLCSLYHMHVFIWFVVHVQSCMLSLSILSAGHDGGLGAREQEGLAGLCQTEQLCLRGSVHGSESLWAVWPWAALGSCLSSVPFLIY